MVTPGTKPAVVDAPQLGFDKDGIACGYCFPPLEAICARGVHCDRSSGYLGDRVHRSPPPVWRPQNLLQSGVPVSTVIEHAGFLILYSGLLVLCCHTQKLYRGVQVRSGGQEAWAVINAVGLATLLLSSFLFLSGVKTISRLVIGLTVTLSAVALVGWRSVRRMRMQSLAADGIRCRNVLILGADKLGRNLGDYFTENRQLGYVVKGFLESKDDSGKDRAPERSASDRVAPILGAIEDLPLVARAHFVDEVFITLPSDREVVKWVEAQARECGLDVRVVPDLYDNLASRSPIEYLGPFLTISVHQRVIPFHGLLLKRILDLIGSAAALIFLSPLLLAIICAVRFSSHGPVFYGSARIGKKGKIFTCYKFRTMVADADTLKDSLRQMNERDGVLFKIAEDPRITRLGCILRKYSLDELPQLWNVLKGDMSLVGPRPPIPGEFSQYAIEHFRRLEAVPGITGLWQVTARQSSSFDEYIKLDLHYIENWSLWLDIKLLFMTIGVVLAGTGR